MTDTIILSGRRFDIRPLKLGQLRHLLDALDEMSGKSAGGLIEAAAKVVAAGLAATHPDLGAAALLELEASIDELTAAVAAILRLAGLRPVGEAQSPDGRPPWSMGRAVPGMASPENSSAPSTAPSPPAAATPTGRSIA